jgi:phage baseplate assembly protein W
MYDGDDWMKELRMSTESKEFLGVGWKTPVNVDASKKIAMSKYEEDIKEAIIIILKTSKGERVMHPDFGCGIHDMVFQTINLSTLSLIEMTVREALTKYEPRIVLLKVNVSTEQAQRGMLIIRIDYKVRSTNNQFNIVYPFYLNEGT